VSNNDREWVVCYSVLDVAEYVEWCVAVTSGKGESDTEWHCTDTCTRCP